VRQQERYQRVKHESAEAAKEAAVLPNPEKLNFLHEVNKSVYDGKSSVEERLQRNRHYRQSGHALEETGIATK